MFPRDLDEPQKKTEGRKRKKIFWNFLLGLFNLLSNGTMMMMIMLMRA